MLEYGAVDAWINPNLGEDLAEDRDVDYLFPHLRELKRRGTTLEQLIDEMDEAGVERGVLCAGYGDVDDVPWVNEALDKHPERFAGSIVIHPSTGMDGVRRLESLVKNHNYRMVRFLAFDTQLPYDSYQYFPFYAKAIELDILVGVNVGIPGPKVPGKHQHPLALDEICYYLPELKVVMSHGGDPWAALCVKLMLKWENLYYMSSAWAPRHIPKEIIHYLNTRGTNKVMWASDYPLLTLDRCTAEFDKVDFRSDAHRKAFVRDNALRLFFPEAAAKEAAEADAAAS